MEYYGFSSSSYDRDGGSHTVKATTTSVFIPTLMPSIPYATHLALTATAIAVFGLIFLFVYAQMWMILYYKHKRRSYQTIFLFLCLIWAALRVTLFSFYFSHDTIIVANNELNPFFYWLLYSFPVVLQFTTLVLLVSFFSQVSECLARVYQCYFECNNDTVDNSSP